MRRRPPAARGRPSDAGDVVELAAVMVGVFALLALTLYFGKRWLAAEAASAAARQALEVAQTDGGDPADAHAVAARIAESSRAVTDVHVTVGGDDTTVDVTVAVTPV
nr:hypothetical protein [Micromonospora sp. DSM 115978]